MCLSLKKTKVEGIGITVAKFEGVGQKIWPMYHTPHIATSPVLITYLVYIFQGFLDWVDYRGEGLRQGVCGI
jgi:hypothetical protein